MSLKSILAGLVVAAFAVVSVNAMAEDKAAGAEVSLKKAMAVQELTLTGKLVMKEDIKADAKATDKVEKDKEVVKVKEEATMICKYALETADGEVALPEPKAKAGEKAIDMAALVGKNVKVVAKGSEKTVDGKKMIKVRKIVSVTEEAASTAAPAAAPAAEKPAEAPAAK
jgi:hypothetical protein